jgi:CRP-like cAMP-binding protein
MQTPSSLSSPNKLLARLPVDDYQRLLPDLKTMRLRPKFVLIRPGVPVHKIYFLGGGVCSITRATADGQMAGVAIVGNEGLIGMNELEANPEPGETAVVEIAYGDAQVMDANVFRREMERRSAFSKLVHSYSHAFVETLMQSIVCNALHPVEMRCARCLLEIRDRLGQNEFPLTQYALANLLGVRRATVTLCVGRLRRMGLVEQQHRRIAIRNPAGLEAAACECYNVNKGHFAHAFQ